MARGISLEGAVCPPRHDDRVGQRRRYDNNRKLLQAAVQRLIERRHRQRHRLGLPCIEPLPRGRTPMQRFLIVTSALVAASIAGPTVAKADTGPAPAGGHAYVLPTAGRWTAEPAPMYAAPRRHVAAHNGLTAVGRQVRLKC